MNTMSLNTPIDAASHFRFGVTGMTCASCVGRVEKALARVPGVQSASVNLATESARIQVLPGTSRESLVDAIAGAGYSTAADDPQAAGGMLGAAEEATTPKAQAAGRERRHLVIAALLSDDNRWITAQRIEASGGMFL